MSANIRWIVGHITELMIPDALFTKFVSEINGYTFEEVFQIHSVTDRILNNKKTTIILYESALADFLATGEIDFFNNKIIASPVERIALLEYLIDLVSNKQCPIRLIEGALFPEYIHLYNPNLYISDSICYLRVENAYNRDCVFQIVDSNSKNLLVKMYDQLWQGSSSAVIGNVERIIDRLVHYLNLAKLIDI